MADMESQAQDVSYKMSKKIAQLTKVIYQLNCRNEDHDSSIRSLASTYEDEISEIMVDARDKIKTLKDELESRREEKKLQRIVEELTRQHNREKAEAMRIFDEFKNKSAQQEMTIKKGVDERISKMTTDLTAAKDAFKKQVDSLEQKLADKEKGAAEEIAALRKLKEDEINGLVVTYNDKYKAMLSEQMGEQDKLEARLNAEWQAKLDALNASSGSSVSGLSKQLSDEATKVRQLNNEVSALKTKVSELEAIKSQNETEIFRLKSKLEQTSEALKVTQGDLVESSDWVKNLTAKNDQLETDLKSEKAAHETQRSEASRLATTLEKKEERITVLENELAVLKQMNDQATAAGGSAAEQVKNLNATVSDLTKRLASVEGHLSAAKEELQNVTEDRDALRLKVEELTKALTQKEAALLELEKQKTAELSQMKADYEARIEAISSNSNESQGTLISQHQQALAKLRADLDAQHDQLLEAKMNEWAKKMAAREEELRAEAAVALEQAKEDHAKAIAALQQQHAAELERIRGDLEGASSAASGEKASFLKQIEDLNAEHQSAMSKLRSEKDAELESLRNANAHLSDEVQTKLRTQIAQLEERVKSLEAALSQSKESEDRLQKVIADEKKALERAKAEHADALNNLRKELEAEFAKRSESAANSTASNTEKQLADLRAQLEREKAMEIQRLNRERIEELNALRGQMDAAAARYDDQIASLNAQINSLKQSGSASSDAHAAEIAKLQQEMSVADDAHRKSMAATKADYEARLAELASSSKNELDAAKRAADEEIAQLKAAHEATLTQIAGDARQAQRDMEEGYKNKLASLERRKDEEKESKLREIQERLSGEMQRANEQHSAELEALKTARSQLDKENGILTSQRDEWSRKAKALEAQVQDLERKVADAHTLAERTAEEHKSELAAQKALLEQDERDALAAQAASHASDVAALKAQFEEEKNKLKTQIKHLQRAVADLEYKYANRESRQEDVQKINSLMKEVKEREDALIKAHNDMKFYKLELVNREESYNKVFGRQPSVSQAADENRMPAGEVKAAPPKAKHVDPPGVRRTKSLRQQ